ncbi:hypothetical protein M9Y10_042104 [Tritrichomonas musculus]|uniref:protein disulfide-isomerase n=1 Tax=Tritrichomonas musculus TaxID=1915356 RepID=A0ABR2K722_9EUKA
MILFTLVSIIIDKSLTPQTFKGLVQDKKPLIVRFSSEHRPRSVQLNLDWKRFSEMYEAFQDIRISHVNCGKYNRLCLREGCWDPPIVRLYMNNTVVQYDGGMSYESLGEWARRYTGIQGKFIYLDVQSPNNRTFNQLIEEKKCVFVMFHKPNCKRCNYYLQSLADIGKAFKNEENVSICEVDTDKYKSFLFDYQIRKYPEFDLFIDGKRKIFEGEFTIENAIDYINDFCGTQRSESGELTIEVGLIDDASPIVEDFMLRKNPKYINDMKNIPGTEFYVEVMNNIIQKGNDYLFTEANRLSSLLAEQSASQTVQDKLKIKYNILSLFISYVETED